MAVGEGRGKLLLFGEHSAVYGYPAVGIQLDRGLRLELEERPADEWFLPELEPGAAKMIAEALERLPHVCDSRARAEARSRQSRGRRVTLTSIDGDLPMSMGFGSSAAFCTALVRAYAPALATDAHALWRAAHELEHIFHGSPSGIDTGLAVFPGASLIRPRPSGSERGASADYELPTREAVTLPPAALLVGALPREESTAELIAGLREQKRERPRFVGSRMERLGRIAEHGAGAASRDELGKLADEAHALLRELGLSTPSLDELLEHVRGFGAVGAKLSGAGGGGAFYAVFADREGALRAAESIKKNGLPYLSVEETVNLQHKTY
ncbi:MAG: mevalonate kinase [Spirochaetota bacterium]